MSIPMGNMNVKDFGKLAAAGQSLFGSIFGEEEEAGYKHPLDLGFRDKLVLATGPAKVTGVGDPDDLGIVVIRLEDGVQLRVPQDAKLRVA